MCHILENRGVSGIKVTSEDLLSNGFNICMNTRGASMFPCILSGDEITISSDKNLKIGDIILLNDGQQKVCHRLVKLFEKNGTKYLQTRGDSLFDLDEPITADQILGKIVRIRRDKITFSRRILQLLHPALRLGRLNAFAISTLLKFRALLPSTKS